MRSRFLEFETIKMPGKIPGSTPEFSEWCALEQASGLIAICCRGSGAYLKRPWG